MRPKLNTREQITQAVAEQFITVVEEVRQVTGQQLPFDTEEQAHFFSRLLLCLFAETIGRLDNDFVPPNVPPSLIAELLNVCRFDWSELEPSIFGTLFERVLDPTKRHQMGAHYTSKADIELIIEPVLMQPLREEWQTVKGAAMSLIHQGDREAAGRMLPTFADKIAAVTVLDPACGSGNFLYIALQHLLDLQKEVLIFAERYDLPAIPLTVNPGQLHGMEINVYAHELAQVTIWIGYIQWRYQNGFKQLPDPILSPLKTIKRMDAILAYDEAGQPVAPEWIPAEVVIGNPPFLGNKRLRRDLGDKYVDDLYQVYGDKVPHEADLVCYWFEKARAMIEHGHLNTAGLLATQAIRGGANRQVLEQIVKHNRIFMAWSDKKWILDGATVHISLVGFDNGNGRQIMLDGREVLYINADLTTGADLIQAQILPENSNLSFMGDTKQGPFDIDQATAQKMIHDTSNPPGYDNRSVIRPWINGTDITRRNRNMWIIDFGLDMSEAEAENYTLPFQYVKEVVKPQRQKSERDWYREEWWLHYAPRPLMRSAISDLKRYIVTPRVSKYRLFIWMSSEVLADSATIVFARDDDYFFGILHSTWHELWARRMGSQLRDAKSGCRYTPTTCFETFPFPWPPGTEPSEADNPAVNRIADLARQLVQFRQGWLQPVEPMIGDKVIKKRTLTNLYNGLELYREIKPSNDQVWGASLEKSLSLGQISGRQFLTLADIETLHWLHTELDRAVLAAYGWPADLNEEQILANLLALNLARATISMGNE